LKGKNEEHVNVIDSNYKNRINFLNLFINFV